MGHKLSPWLVFLCALALAAPSCGGDGGGGGTAVTTTPGTRETTEPLTSAQHAEQLAEGESAALAAELVDVPGFYYEDVGEEELRTALGAISELAPLAASFHVVRQVSSGDEIAFLQLLAIDPNDAVHAPVNWESYGRGVTGADDVRTLAFSGQTVFLAEEPSEPASRYKYVWLRHGTAGWADGPDRGALEGWLKAYFAVAVVLPGENPALVERLVPVPGFAYTNETSREITRTFTQAFDGVGYSVHNAFDKVHKFGSIVLIGPAPSLTEQRFVAGIASSLSHVSGVQPVEEPGLEMEGMAVYRLLSKGGGVHLTTFVWWWSDARIGGALATERPDIGEPFLRALLAAQPS